MKKRWNKIIAGFLVSLMLMEVGPLSCPVFAIHTGWGDLHDGTPLGQVTPTTDKGNPETTDIPANNDSKNCTDVDPILMTTGEFTESYTDVLIPSRGMPTEITRSYRSQRSLNNRFGYGWNFNFYKRLQKLVNGNMLLIDGETTRKVEFVMTVNPEYTSPDGVYQQLRNNGNGTHTLTEQDGLQYIFDIDGKVTTKRDRNGNQLLYTYDAGGLLPISGKSPFLISATVTTLAYDYKLTRITDTVGRFINFTYYADGRLNTITDFAGRVWTYNYLNDDLISVKFPATAAFPSGITKSFTYDTQHNLKTAVNGRGKVYVTNVYDTSDRVQTQTYCGGTATLAYDPTAKKTTVTDRKGFVTIWTYDAQGHITQKEDRPAGLRTGEPTSYITKYTYNTPGEILTVTLPKGNGIKYTYNSSASDPRARGNLLTVRRKASMAAADSSTNDLITTFTYETRFNQIKTVKDALNFISTFTYDYELATTDARYADKGNPVTVTLPTVATVVPQINLYYNAFGQVVKNIDANSIVTDFVYFTANGYLQEVRQDPTGINAITKFTYDPYGNIDTMIDPENRTTNLDFNALNQLDKSVSVLLFQTKYLYDEDGNVKQIDRQVDTAATIWQSTKMTYDDVGKVLTLTDPLTRATTYTYDANEKLATVKDANTKITTYQYDERDLLFKVTDANAGVTQYDYDLNGNLSKLTDAKLNATQYAYDGFDRLMTETYADTSKNQYGYDKNSNLTLVTTPSTKQIQFVYDALNRLTSRNYPSTPAMNASLSYDTGSRLTQVLTADATDKWTYDKLNRVFTDTQIIGGKTYASTFAYDKAGNRTRLLYPSAKDLRFTYEADNLLKTISTMVGTTSTALASYIYDPLRRRAQRDLTDGGVAKQSIYNYNLANELSILTNQITPSTIVSKYTYTYDTVSNRKTLAQQIGATVKNFTYTYNNIYELTGVSGGQTHSYLYDKVGNRTTADSIPYISNTLNQYTKVNNITQLYDPNGNMTSDGTNTYVFNEDNQQVSMTGGGNTATYKYDGLGRRISKTVNGVLTVFVFDGDEIIEERDSTGALTASYVYGSNLDEPLLMTRGTTKSYYFQDGLGSTANIVNVSGVVVESYEYDVYGKPSLASTISNPIMFTGRWLDKESGNYDYRARSYSSKLGRFLQRDPIGYFDSMNLYGYGGNSPINFVDPLGLWSRRGAIQGLKNTAIGVGVGLGIAGAIALVGLASPAIATGLLWTAAVGGAAGLGLSSGAAITGRTITGKVLCEDDRTSLAVESMFGIVTLGTAALATKSFTPYWKYRTPTSSTTGGYMTRGVEAPYGKDYPLAKSKLQLNEMPIDVRELNIPWYKPVIGPRPVSQYPQHGEGGAWEYFTGWGFPKSDPNW